jgi:Zn-dependent protease
VVLFDDHSVPGRQDNSALAREIEEALAAMDSPRTKTVQSILILVGSLVLFAGFQLVNTSVSGLVILVVVLAIHELGHLVAMKLTGYRDLQMFFIPLIGAAAYGSETRPTGTRRALVSLAGPVPGIAIGLVCTVLFHVTGSPVVMESARTFLIVNTFNLLPVSPLDGGRYMEAVLFSRTPMLKAAFDVLAAAALVALAFMLRSVIFGILAYVTLLTIRFTYVSAKMAREIKRELAEERATDPASASVPAGPGGIPSSYIERFIPLLEAHLTQHEQTPAGFTRAFQTIWTMVRFQPPSAAATVALLLLYAICFGGGIIATIAAELSFRNVA